MGFIFVEIAYKNSVLVCACACIHTESQMSLPAELPPARDIPVYAFDFGPKRLP